MASVCPKSFWPQQLTVPSPTSAQLCVSPASTSMYRVRSQSRPVNAGEQSQVTLVPLTLQVPPFRQGFGSHPAMSSSQRSPAKPSGHSHTNASTPSWQMPPFTQGFVVQSSMFVRAVVAAKPSAQSQ